MITILLTVFGALTLLFAVASISVNAVITFIAIVAAVALLVFNVWKHSSPDVEFRLQNNKKIVAIELMLVFVVVCGAGIILMRSFA